MIYTCARQAGEDPGELNRITQVFKGENSLRLGAEEKAQGRFNAWVTGGRFPLLLAWRESGPHGKQEEELNFATNQ